MPNAISLDATLKDVFAHLTHPQQYVGGIYQKLRAVERQHGNAWVKIGVSGTGQKPYYRIIYRTSSDPSTEVIEGSYFDNHTSLKDENLRDDALTARWSTASMSFREVEDWARGLNIGRKAPPPTALP